MNKMRCGFCLVLFTLLFSPALAKGKSSPPAPEALFQACAATAATAALPTDALTVPEPLFANHCNAQQLCPSQCLISCTGHTSCTVQATSVTCDGITTNCPYPGCNPPLPCVNQGTGCDWCECIAAGGTPLSCRFHCFP